LSNAVRKNGPKDDLDQYTAPRKKIKLGDVKNFVEKRFDRLKKGTTFANLEKEFGVSKRWAQRILKRGRQMGVFFTPVRKNPEEYFPESRHFKVIEHINNQKNVLKGTTGTSRFNSPLSFAIEQQKASNFLEVLLFAKYISRQINKIELEPVINRKEFLKTDYYHMLSVKEWPQNQGKLLVESIDEREINFVHYENGAIMITIACSKKPFNIETEEDIINLFSFFGQVRDRLENQICDRKGRIVGQIGDWILKQCEVNKDIPITDSAQLTLPDIQLSTANRVFRSYVKNLQGHAYNRIEEVLKVNLPVKLLESVLFPQKEILFKLDTILDILNKKDT
jgi:hypothetical protein